MQAESSANVVAVVTAGGAGKRFGGHVPKQFQEVLGKSILEWTLDIFEKHSKISHIILTLPKTHVGKYNASYWHQKKISKITQVIEGGDSRQASVFNGLKAAPQDTKYVLIHDGARCVLHPSLIDDCLEKCKSFDGAIAAVPVTDSLKWVEGGVIKNNISRENMWAMQTPQTFRFPFILNAYEAAKNRKIEATDDAALAQSCGGKVAVVENAYENIKVTYAQDLKNIEDILKRRMHDTV